MSRLYFETTLYSVVFVFGYDNGIGFAVSFSTDSFSTDSFSTDSFLRTKKTQELGHSYA
jgi:hypothetical protein